MPTKKKNEISDVDNIVAVSNWLRQYTRAIFDPNTEFDKNKWEQEGEKIEKILSEVIPKI